MIWRCGQVWHDFEMINGVIRRRMALRLDLRIVELEQGELWLVLPLRGESWALPFKIYTLIGGR